VKNDGVKNRFPRRNVEKRSQWMAKAQILIRMHAAFDDERRDR
jgi:hypothetical protein